jgi:hypothetical protein
MLFIGFPGMNAGAIEQIHPVRKKIHKKTNNLVA